MVSRKKKMIQAAAALGQYYGLGKITSQDILSVQDQAGEDVKNKLAENGTPMLQPIHVLLNDILINNSNGMLLTKDIVQRITDISNTDDVDLAEDLIRIFYNGTNLPGTTRDPDADGTWSPLMADLLSDPDEKSSTNPADNAHSPSKENPTLSLIMSNSPRVSLEHKNIDPTVIFLNGIPNIELSRATPFMNINFFAPRAPLDGQQRHQSLSLLKFLNGAEVAELDSPSGIMAEALKVPKNKLTNPLPDDPPDFYTQSGMEMFTSPQTLVNGDTQDDPELYTAAILDKFRPFMTIKDLSLSILGTRGLMSYKSGKLKLVLHDRSRLTQVADFLRADLYGREQLSIEYGWSHPGADNLGAGQTNHYASLIDGMRMKERYRIINSSFSFEDAGEVAITLELAMEGAASFNTELISSKLGEQTPGQMLQQMEDLQKTISELGEKFNPSENRTKSKKIKGHQFLNVAGDAIHHMSMDAKTINQLKALQRALASHEHPDADKLLDSLNELVGTEQEVRKGNVGGLVQKYKKSVAQSITQKIKALDVKDDPFLTKENLGPRNVLRSGNAKKRTDRILGRDGFTLPKTISSRDNTSLGKILLSFVGEPLANTKQYDEVQILTHNFNDFAGAANSLNISEFAVNLEHFAQQLFKHRMEHIGKSGNMSISEFLDFLGDVILDDPAAVSYGLHGSGKSKAFFKEVVDKNGELKFQNNNLDAPTLEMRINEAVKDYGGKWQPPIIEYYIETNAQELEEEDGVDPSKESAESILRIHFFDKTASSYSTVENVLQATREGQVSAINAKRSSTAKGTNTTVEQEKLSQAKTILERADEASEFEGSLLKKIVDPVSGEEIYKIVGGPRQLKKFLMDTTPYIIYGAIGSTVKNAQLTSMHDSKLATVNLLRSHQKSELEPNGENPGGLPLQIIPTELTMECEGNPLMDFTQTFFVDFQTGTSADALYRVYGVEHKISAGEFVTSVKLTPSEGYGQYYALADRISKAAAVVKEDKGGADIVPPWEQGLL